MIRGMEHTTTESHVVAPHLTGAGPLPERSTFQLLSARDAARAICVSERTLFSLTKSGQVASVRIGRAVRYDPSDLRAFVERAKATACR